MSFLPDATNFVGMTAKPDPATLYPDKAGHVPCPKCHGYGGWNLTLNAYGPGKHFQASCSQCWGWGWVKAGTSDVTCLHSFKEIAPDQPFRCWHTIRCEACGETRSYSSDD